MSEDRSRWRRLLLPLVPVYALALRMKRGVQRSGRFEQRHLGSAVISVGSVSAGGAGKTPVVLLLAEMLKRRGYEVRILTRGYGRSSDTVERVERGGSPGGSAARYGDEPMLLAERSGVPVYVGANRYRAGRMAEAAPPGKTAVFLLDDGFQHRQLARDIDIVLLTKADVEDRLLPAGNLREPLTALREAHVIVLREDEAESLRDFVSRMTRETGAPPIWLLRRRLEFTMEEMAVRPTRPMVFCGIARPEGFFKMLEADGCRPAGQVPFPDHHRYRERDITGLIEAGRKAGADGFYTTEKDGVKLTPAIRRRLEELGPLVIPRLRVELLDEKMAMEQMIGMVDRLDRRQRT